MAATCTSIAAPALAAQYALMPRPGCTAFRLAVTTIAPPSVMRGAVCLIVSMGPTRHTSTVRFQSSTSESTMSPLVPMPALANAMSRRPNASDAVAASDFDRTLVGDVALDDPHGVTEPLLDLVEPRLVDVADDDPRALGDEPLHRGEPDARPAAGHDRDLVLEPHAGAFSTTSSGAIS